MIKYTNNAQNCQQQQQQQMSSNQYRHRSHTINPVLSREGQRYKVCSPAPPPHTVNLCGYDSYLHATICAQAGGHGGGIATPNTVGVATPMKKRCTQKMIKSRMLRHQQQMMVLTAGQQQQQSPQMQQQQQHHHQNVDQRMVVEKGVKMGRKQKALLMRRTRSKEELVVSGREKINVVEGLLGTESFIEKLKITEDFAERHVSRQGVRNELVMEYGSVPVTAEPGECERLLAPTPSDEVLTVVSQAVEEKMPSAQESPKSQAGLLNSFGPHVHTHIHHHYHHFENEEGTEKSLGRV